MPTPNEKKAVVFLGALALLGIGVRVERGRKPPPPPTVAEQAALSRQIMRVDSVRKHGRAPRSARGREVNPARASVDATAAAVAPAIPRTSSRAPELIDLDRASAAEIERLPRIGPTLAARIVADRDSLGPFRSLKGLERVRGVGPAMARTLAPLVSFSGRKGQ